MCHSLRALFYNTSHGVARKSSQYTEGWRQLHRTRTANWAREQVLPGACLVCRQSGRLERWRSLLAQRGSCPQAQTKSGGRRWLSNQFRGHHAAPGRRCHQSGRATRLSAVYRLWRVFWLNSGKGVPAPSVAMPERISAITRRSTELRSRSLRPRVRCSIKSKVLCQLDSSSSAM